MENFNFDDFDEVDFNDTVNSTVVWEDVSFFENMDLDLDFGHSTDPTRPDSTVGAPKRTKRKQSLNIRCHRCSNSYETTGGYAEHLKTHAWEDIRSRVPSEVEWSQWVHECAPEVLSELRGCIYNAGSGPAMLAFIGTIDSASIEWSQFVNYVSRVLFQAIYQKIDNMPSNFYDHAISSVLKFLGTAETRAEAQWLLSRCHCEEVSKVVVAVVAQKLIFNLVERMVVKHLQKVKLQTVNSGKVVTNISKNHKIMKIIHYSAGSAVKGVIRKCFRYRHNMWWSAVSEVVKRCFRIGDSNVHVEGSEWTKIRDRGGLTLISSNALSFFMSVAQILEGMEQSSRIASHVQLLEAIFRDADAMKKWDNVCEGRLPQEDSMRLMVLICRGFCNTYARGVIRKRKNTLKRFASVPLRSQLAKK